MNSPRGRSLWGRAVVCGAAGIALVAISATRWTSPSTVPADQGVASTTVVVAALDIAPGAVLEDSMLTKVSVSGQVARGLVTDPRAVQGKVLLVPVGRGEALASSAVASTASGPAAGRRLLALDVATADVAADVGPGVDADVVASFAGTSTGAHPEVTVIATVRIVAVGARTEAEGGLPSAPDQAAVASGAPSPAGTSTVTVDCPAGDALRIVWARDNSRGLLLIGHPAGDGGLATVDDLSGHR